MCTIGHYYSVVEGHPHNDNIFCFLQWFEEDLEISSTGQLNSQQL